MGAMEPIEYLRQVPLFSRLSDDHLRLVAEASHQELFARHSYLSQAGRPGRGFYYIVSGEAVVRALTPGGHPRPVAFMRAGDYFGVTSLLLGEPHDATVQATTEVIALVLGRADLARLKQEAPDLEEELELPDEVSSKLQYATLPWLAPNEVVVYLGRRHWMVFLRAMLLPTLGILAFGLLLHVLLRAMQAAWYLSPIISLVILIPVAIWNLVDWRNDYFAVTTQRVVHRELIAYVYESRQEAPLSTIQDVTILRNFAGNVLGYGNVVIKTAAQAGVDRIVFDHVSDPAAAKDIIFQQIYRSRAGSQVTEREVVRRELKRHLRWATAEELRRQPQEPPGRATAPEGHTRAARPSRLPRIRLFPQLRIVEGSRITWRKHWWFLWLRLAKPAAAFAFWLLLFLAYATGRIALPPVRPGGAFLGFVIGALLLGFWFWFEYRDWENDIYVLTDDRIIDIEKTPILGKEDRREATLDRIQNVNLTVPGALAVALNYGNVDIDTAGGGGKFTFSHVMAPHTVQQDIMGRVAQYQERRRQIESQQRRREMAEWFAEYEELRRGRGGAAPPPATPPEAGQPQ